jgi:hypothetical protein
LSDVADPRTALAALTDQNSLAELQLAVMTSGPLMAVIWAGLRVLTLARRTILRR